MRNGAETSGLITTMSFGPALSCVVHTTTSVVLLKWFKVSPVSEQVAQNDSQQREPRLVSRLPQERPRWQCRSSSPSSDECFQQIIAYIRGFAAFGRIQWNSAAQRPVDVHKDKAGMQLSDDCFISTSAYREDVLHCLNKLPALGSLSPADSIAPPLSVQVASHLTSSVESTGFWLHLLIACECSWWLCMYVCVCTCV